MIKRTIHTLSLRRRNCQLFLVSAGSEFEKHVAVFNHYFGVMVFKIGEEMRFVKRMILTLYSILRLLSARRLQGP